MIRNLALLLSGLGVVCVLAHPAAAQRWRRPQGLQCVQFVKQQKPEFARVNRGAWSEAADLWQHVTDKGQQPRVGAVIVIDRWRGAGGNGSAGHVAIVERVEGATVSVSHANWDRKGQVSRGRYVIAPGGGSVRYVTENGVMWRTPYPLRGFVYSSR